MISCDNARELIQKILDGTVETTERAELEAHVQTCQACRDALKRFELMEEVIADALVPDTEAVRARARIIAQLPERTGTSIRISSHWTRTAVAAAVMLAAGLALGFVVGREGQSQTPEAVALREVPMRIGHLEGMVLVKHDNSDVWEPLQSGAVVYLGDMFHSTPKSEFVLDLGNNSTIAVNPNSMLVLAEYGNETEFSLKQGECTADLQSPHGPFFVRTPHGRMEALGTEFTVTVE
jgi:ferric-dicitrate binding protein FerR (iron transport regulator)